MPSGLSFSLMQCVIFKECISSPKWPIMSSGTLNSTNSTQLKECIIKVCDVAMGPRHLCPLKVCWDWKCIISNIIFTPVNLKIGRWWSMRYQLPQPLKFGYCRRARHTVSAALGGHTTCFCLFRTQQHKKFHITREIMIKMKKNKQTAIHMQNVFCSVSPNST